MDLTHKAHPRRGTPDRHLRPRVCVQGCIIFLPIRALPGMEKLYALEIVIVRG